MAPDDSSPDTGAKPPPDWERIEAEYRAGLLSLREIAAPFKVTEGAIRKRAKRDGWERDLGPKIQAKADALVRKDAVRAEVRNRAAASERDIVDANATAVATVILAQRTDITRSRTLAMKLMSELEAQTGNFPGLVALGEILRQPDDNGADKLNDLYRAIISLPERTKTMKALAESLKNLIALEREAFNIDGAPPPPPSGTTDWTTIAPEDRQAAYLKYVGGH